MHGLIGKPGLVARLCQREFFLTVGAGYDTLRWVMRGAMTRSTCLLALGLVIACPSAIADPVTIVDLDADLDF
jgi:hypothetical protein